MKQYRTIHNRKSIRLKEYDYMQAGDYFVTLCAHGRQCVFGEVHGEEMHLNEIGNIARRCWEEIPQHFPFAELDAFVVMPNHLHGIIVIRDLGRDVQLNVPTSEKTHASISPCKRSLSVIIRTFKAAVTTLCRTNGYQNFRWQSRFYDHIIRDRKDLDRICEYIIENPIKWYLDENNPNRPVE